MPRPSLRIILVAFAVLLAAAPARAQGVPGTVLSDYQARLAIYLQARQAYDAQAEVYWNAVVEKRRVRNAKRRNRQPIELTDYVLTQPPLYTGPRRPIDPQAPGPPPRERPPIPVVADFLQAAAEQYNFVPQRPASDLDFKRAYARTARAVGLTREQIVGVYAFETGGRGAYDTQAGLEPPGPASMPSRPPSATTSCSAPIRCRFWPSMAVACWRRCGKRQKRSTAMPDWRWNARSRRSSA